MIQTLILCACFVLGGFAVEVQYNAETECAIRGPQYWCRNEEIARQCQATNYCSEHVWSKKQVKSGGLCTECQQYVGTIHLLLSNNDTQAEILNGLKAACALFPTSVQSLCTEAVDTYGNQLIQAVVQYTANPKQFCSMIGLCNSTNVHTEINSLFVKKLVIEKFFADYCLTCQQYVGTFHLLISNNASRTELLSVLQSACSLLPSSYASECTGLVKIYGPLLINELVDYTADPTKFCTVIGLCKGSERFPLVKESMLKNVIKFNMAPKVPAPAPEKKVESEVTCVICEFAMRELDSILKSNSTQAEIEDALKKVCSLLPSTVGAQCDAFVNIYFPSIVDILVNELGNPSAVCKQLHVCGNAKKVEKPVTNVLMKKHASNGASCEVCTVAMGYLDDILKDQTTEAAVKKALDSLCGYLPPSLKSECTSLVSEYGEQIIKLLVAELDPSLVCKELGLCTSAKKNIIKSVATPKSAITCTVCKYAVSYLDSLLEDNRTEVAIRGALDRVCAYLPSSYSAECKSFVDVYTDEIVRLLVSELAQPNQLCTELKLCSSAKGFLVMKAKAPKNSVTCELCTVAMGYLDNMIKQNSTEAAVKQALDELCGKLPSSLREECTILVSEYTDEIINLIVQELADPATLCKQLGLCTSMKKVLATRQEEYSSSITCEFCMYAMGELSAVLKDKSTEAEIKQALDSLCSKLPQYLSSECTHLVDEYEDAIITLLAQEMDPTQVCKTIGLCKSKQQEKYNGKYMLAMRLSLRGVSCEICEYAMGYLDKLLESKSSEAEIKKAVEELCGYLPSAIKNECDALIIEYGDEIIKLIVNQIKPDVICKKLKLC